MEIYEVCELLKIDETSLEFTYGLTVAKANYSSGNMLDGMQYDLRYCKRRDKVEFDVEVAAWVGYYLYSKFH